MCLFKCGCGSSSCECTLINESDLPTFAIDGMTAGAWSHIGAAYGMCVWEQVFTFDTATSVSKSCANLRTSTMDMHCKQERYAKYDTRANISLPVACCPEYILCGTYTRNYHAVATTDVVFGKKPTGITVRVGRVAVDCGSGPVCKYVIESTYTYSVSVDVYDYKNMVATTSAVAIHACCEVTGGCGDTTKFGSHGEPFDCSTKSPSGVGTTFAFSRWKFYDSLPTGTTELHFTNSDLATGCVQSPFRPTFFYFNGVLTQCIEMAPEPAEHFCTCLNPTLVSVDVTPSWMEVDFTCEQSTWLYNCAHLTGPQAYSVDEVTAKCDPVLAYKVPDIVGSDDYYGEYPLSANDKCNSCDMVDGHCLPQPIYPPTGGCQVPHPCSGNSSGVPKLSGGFFTVTEHSVSIACGSWNSAALCIGAPAWSISMVV